jgi:hypothetical protein
MDICILRPLRPAIGLTEMQGKQITNNVDFEPLIFTQNKEADYSTNVPKKHHLKG